MAESLKEQKLGVSNMLWSCIKSLKTFTNDYLLYYTLIEAPENSKESSRSAHANGINE
jgi:hypothetical protein